MGHPETYQTMLRSELATRIGVNSRYSLRSFARQLKLSPAYVSQVLNGHRTLSIHAANEVAKSLKWDYGKSRRFIELISLERVTDSKTKVELRKKIERSKVSFKDLELEHQMILADWRYAAILELTEVDGFKSCERWIAKRLGITVIETGDILFRLIRAGLLAIGTDGQWKKTDHHISMTGPHAKKAIQSYHHQVLKRAQGALTDPIPEREFRSITVATSPARMSEFKQRIRAFEDEMMTFMEEGERRSIFQFSIQLFRVDKDMVPQ